MNQDYFFERMPIAGVDISTNHRKIIKGSRLGGDSRTVEVLERFESRSMHGQIPLVWSRAHDYNVYDEFGNKWIDFTSTIFVANIGHSNKHLENRLIEQIKNELIASYAYPVQIRAEYIKKLIQFVGPPFEKAFLLSAGTETTEAAIKLMRMNGKKNKKRRGGIVVFSGNWHGRTLGAQLLSNNKAQKDWIYSHDPDIFYLPFPYPWETTEEGAAEFFETSFGELRSLGIEPSLDVCGFMLETFQGWGAFFYPKNFVKRIRETANKIDALLCFDEMQSGFARTGKAFGYQHYEVEPDLICCGKGMGGGFPLSGVIGRTEIMDLPSVGNMSSTHSGNPLSCAAGLAVIEEIERLNLIDESKKKGEYLALLLDKICLQFPNIIKGNYGNGLIRSLVFYPEINLCSGQMISGSRLASKIVDLCFHLGVLFVHTGRESIKLGPPLTTPMAAIEEAIEVLFHAISETINA